MSHHAFGHQKPRRQLRSCPGVRMTTATLRPFTANLQRLSTASTSSHRSARLHPQYERWRRSAWRGRTT